MTPTAGRRPPAPRVDEARRTAFDVILAVDVDGAFGNLLLPRLVRDRALAGVDASFATELTYGTLRWQGVLDTIVSAAGKRSVDTLDAPVRAVLRLGSYQLMHMRVPSHAAVDTSVELARSAVGHRVAGLVNAVLRRVAAADFATWTERLAPADDLGRIAFTVGQPDWIAAAFLEALAGDLTELHAALAEDRPVTHLVARPGRITRDELLATAGPGATAGPWSPYAVRLDGGGDPGQLPAVRAGRAAVQDEGSQLVALVGARAAVDGGERWWADVCAGPGGKAALLAGLTPPDVRLLAADVQPHRAGLVAAALAGAGGTVVADATRPAWRRHALDRVLVDVPCTGLGALRRRPEVRWRRQPADVERLHPLQVALLREAIESTRPGGLVVYATCSPHLRETRAVVADALIGGSAQPVDARPFLPDVPGLGEGPDVQLWPHRHGTDAMYIAVLRCEA